MPRKSQCHSGTALDLPYVYSTEGKIKEPNLLAEAGQGLLGAGMSYLKGDMGGLFKGPYFFLPSPPPPYPAPPSHRV